MMSGDHLYLVESAQKTAADPIQDMAKRLGRFDAVWPRLLGYARQAKHGQTQLERELAASMLVELVLVGDEVIER